MIEHFKCTPVVPDRDAHLRERQHDLQRFCYQAEDDIKCSKYATFGTTKLANFVLEACRNRKGCLIANHGQISLGENIDEAVHLSLALEKLAKQYYFCLLSKNFKLLSSNEITNVLKKFAYYKSKH